MSLLINGELVLYGEVGDGWWGDYFTATQVLEALAESGEGDIIVRINSPGGLAYEGVAIFNALNSHPGKVTVYIDGHAMSSASIIAMAGDEIIMRSGAVMMIHDPMTIAWGNVSDFEQAIKGLNTLAEQMAGIYSRVSDQSKEECRTIMRDETWFDGAGAVEKGFATSIEDETALDPVAFDYRQYAKAPEALKMVAKDNGWTFKRPHIPKSTASAKADGRKTEPNPAPQSNQSEESEMTEEELAAIKAAAKAEGAKEATAQAGADAIKAYKDRVNAVKASENYAGNEQLAEHLLDNTEMDASSIAAALAAAPKAQVEDDKGDDKKGKDGGTNPQAYDDGRQSASDLARPSGGGNGGDKPKSSGWKSVVSAANKRAKR